MVLIKKYVKLTTIQSCLNPPKKRMHYQAHWLGEYFVCFLRVHDDFFRCLKDIKKSVGPNLFIFHTGLKPDND